MPRKKCPSCQRPLAVCYCSALVQVTNKTKVVIIQHPLEQKHPFNTGRIAHLCLNNSELIVTETLAEEILEQLLSTHSALLYPSLPWLPETHELATPIKEENLDHSSSTEQTQQLIVIDATWRKSKKILHLNPVLQTLPRINLTGGLTSNYKIRKTSVEDGLSTIESIVEAMQLFEPESNANAMLASFEKMVSLQQSVAQR